MKLQVAIDRVPVERAMEIVKNITSEANIIEIGTSLTKEFGMRALRPVIEAAEGVAVLGDIKTCDEGKYEFDLGYRCGFSYLTVMGSASMGTLEACARSAAEHDGLMMIDLLECDEARIERISGFTDAVYCLHTPLMRALLQIPSHRCVRSRHGSLRFSISRLLEVSRNIILPPCRRKTSTS